MQFDSLSQAFLEVLPQTFSQTPTWVFILFIALLGLGYSQSRQRRVSRIRAFIFPVAMSVFSFMSLNTLVSSGGDEMLVFGLASWLAGLLLVFILVMVYLPGNRNNHGESRERVVYVKQHDIFVLGGSWWPLFLILMLFVFKYVVNVLLATHQEVAEQVAFIVSVSLVYGCFSGFFLSRLIVYRSAMKVRLQAHA